EPEVATCAPLWCRPVGGPYGPDDGFQVFPSLHVAYTVGIWLMFRRYAPRLTVPFGLFVVAIMASTAPLTRHYSVAVPGGVRLGVVGFGLARVLGWRAAHASAAVEAWLRG